MKKSLSLLLVLILMAVSVFGLASCGLVKDGAEISVYLTDEVYDFDPAAAYTDDNAQLLISLLFEPLEGWSKSIITSNPDFERIYGHTANKRRKLSNGGMPCTLYQYFARTRAEHNE